MYRRFLSLLLFLMPFSIFAQEAPVEEELSFAQRIDQSFQPIADGWESFVLYPIPIGDYSIPFILILLVSGATFFTIYFSFPAFTKMRLSINTVRGKYDELEKNYKDPDKAGEEVDESKEGEVSHFQALATAVSGTVGLGNIAGVAVAIAIGGPGATFWMIVCGILGMSNKFVECTLGVKYRDVDSQGTVYGGPMYYLSRGLKNIGKKGRLGQALGGLFAIFCVGASFGGGNTFQSNQAASQLSHLLGIDFRTYGFYIGIVLAILVGVVIIGGIKRIATITEKIVPFMAIIYVLASLVILGAHYDYIDDAFGLIMKGAFTPFAGLGGFVGVLIVGFQRAAFSNEAGAGSAAIAHSAVKTKFPASEGVVALLEPLIDTVIVCTMTALVIIFFNIDGGLGNMQSVFKYGGDGNGNVTLLDGGASIGGVELTTMAYDTAIPNFSYVLTVAIILFAFSTMISWSYYGLQSWKYLFGRSKTSDLTYKVLFVLFVVVGASTTLNAVVKFSDAMILALVFPNMIGLFLLFPQVKKELKKYTNAIKDQIKGEPVEVTEKNKEEVSG
ncbi:alanine/glycine:cation symporter family protein [Echinicola jeungdonensis]|uniref:Alanine/glycine:cation symporter family protein n=1 Tax=Echinicola jeungdonensis TaxID=709343 RepID=A0ABV5J5B5_9BACT|nr:alanine/glycine:cation symporter family protein [Echinicola jeungdonensis]MDN3668698.1 alanine/glycine:cation symporter family protein [Echinicola jeungdonensis]